jgi:hypothetical protein
MRRCESYWAQDFHWGIPTKRTSQENANLVISDSIEHFFVILSKLDQALNLFGVGQVLISAKFGANKLRPVHGLRVRQDMLTQRAKQVTIDLHDFHGSFRNR